jgi:hypothetical protein
MAGYPTSPAPRVPSMTATRNTNVTRRRVVAYLLDWSLVAGLSLVMFTPLLFVRSRLVMILVVLLLFVFDGYRGQTLGKMLCGIAVIRAEARSPQVEAHRLKILLSSAAGSCLIFQLHRWASGLGNSLLGVPQN